MKTSILAAAVLALVGQFAQADASATVLEVKCKGLGMGLNLVSDFYDTMGTFGVLRGEVQVGLKKTSTPKAKKNGSVILGMDGRIVELTVDAQRVEMLNKPLAPELLQDFAFTAHGDGKKTKMAGGTLVEKVSVSFSGKIKSVEVDADVNAKAKLEGTMEVSVGEEMTSSKSIQYRTNERKSMTLSCSMSMVTDG